MATFLNLTPNQITAAVEMAFNGEYIMIDKYHLLFGGSAHNSPRPHLLILLSFHFFF